jgi:hypothetical protein
MRRVEYTTLFADGVRKRHFHERRGKKVICFSVQLEVLVGNEWKVVIRFDCAHGYSLVDQYRQGGAKKKVKLNLDFEKALILADWDIKNNWQKYVSGYYKRKR